MLNSFEEFSMIALYSAMLVYALAFIFFAVDLANRAGRATATAATDEASADQIGESWSVGSVQDSQELSASGAAGATVTATATKARPATSDSAIERTRGSRALRIGFSLTVLAFILHFAATIGRGLAAGRVPWSNMYEFSLTATLAIVLIFLVVNIWVDIRFLGTLITGLVLLFLGVTRVNYYVEVVPLPPALESYWLVIHILVAVLATGFFTLAFGLSIMQLLQSRRERRLAEGIDSRASVLRSIPSSDALENVAYRMAIIGFVFWTFTLIAGSIWAEHAWGRYWGWDTKEVWTFVIWVLYAGYIHARATRGWRGNRSAWLAIVAYSAVIFNFAIVNVFFKGLHAYSGL